MQVEILADDDAVARSAASFIAECAHQAVRERGRFTLALSAVRSPRTLLRELALQPMPWSRLHLFQVDERIAPAGDAARNLTLIESDLLSQVPLPAGRMHAMPVNDADANAAAAAYDDLLQSVCGAPAVLDLVHLGLGENGHTVSLLPGDDVLDVSDADVALSGPYQGWRRMTLTYAALNRARRRLWLVNGANKREMVARLRAGDASIPAGRVRADASWLFADLAAGPNGR